jgi:predicted DNA-binding ribbon-helix-helix protein
MTILGVVKMRSAKNQDARASTITRSFRFENDLSKILDEEAERMGISVNALVGIILKRYCEFTRYLSKIDMIVINREFLTILLDTYDDDSVYKMGIKLGQIIPSDTIMFWKKELNEQSVLDYIEKIICRYGHLGTYDEILQSRGRTIVIRHRLGRKGSIFFQAYFFSALKTMLNVEAKFEITESSLKFDIIDKSKI